MTTDLVIIPEGNILKLSEVESCPELKLKSANAYVASVLQSGKIIANAPGLTQIWIERNSTRIKTLSCVILENSETQLPLLLDRYNKVTRVAGPMMTLPPDFSAPDKTVKLEKKTAEAFCRMCIFAREQGVWLYSTHGYRTVGEQQKLINYFASRDGTQNAMRRCAPARFSEHHSGLAIDVHGGIWKNGSGVQNSALAWSWLAEHCFDFGFMIKNLKGKEHITGTQYEPWHIRYLGDTKLCQELHDRNLTLNEYLNELPCNATDQSVGEYIKALHSKEIICCPEGQQVIADVYSIAGDMYVKLDDIKSCFRDIRIVAAGAPIARTEHERHAENHL